MNLAKTTLPLLALLLSSAAQAQSEAHYTISSGTGFFVSMNGYVITNAHVVNGCERAVIKGDMRRTQAEIVARDAARDLALLRTGTMPQFAAPLRDNIKELKKGDKALVMGYPGDHAITGDYALVDTQIVDVLGPLGNPDSIQFSDSAQKGNSGGPLLDSSGNVIGVIMGKSQVFRVDPVTQEKSNFRNSDVAISIGVLKDFLTQHGVYANDLTSSMDLSRERIVDRAKYYVVNVQCPLIDADTDTHMREVIYEDLTRDAAPESESATSPAIKRAPDGMVIFDKNRGDQ